MIVIANQVSLSGLIAGLSRIADVLRQRSSARAGSVSEALPPGGGDVYTGGADHSLEAESSEPGPEACTKWNVRSQSQAETVGRSGIQVQGVRELARAVEAAAVARDAAAAGVG